ncbi:tripartite tricarboxylate transporter TctB family protein [Pseudacidovorax intermedius]|uniref:Tripartite tricarboxylate transporter TctB family protein n=2 Tax=Pseudacidovorax intermedius TaxID=433924 RepID=A0A370FFH9_9BURK|nr:tripartite tricarboxylate transporter TctB family protein [Pseudacidovorax intermedius]RDI23451.1 tripartite tricarboxylate transporter TctB family protein [Pseudacidovorax intermedius]
MKHRDTHDLIGGIALTVVGVFFGLYASRYTMGTAARMGPGYFPIVLGWLLAVLGLLVALPAWWRQGNPIRVQWRNLATATACLVLFAALLQAAGVLVAAFAASMVALVPARTSVRQKLVISAAVSALTVGIFVFGLQMNVRTFPW